MAQIPQTSPAAATEALTVNHARLMERSPRIRLYEDYYEGIHKLAFATSRFREVFGNLFHEFADNWMELIVDASVERLAIQGFRFGDGDGDSDADAWDIFRDNLLDAESDIAHTEAVKLGTSYLIVDDVERTDQGNPLITVEHPAQVIVSTANGNRRRRTSAVKCWTDESGYVFANVYFPDGIYRFQTNATVQDKDPVQWSTLYGRWYPDDFVAVPAAFLGNDEAQWGPRAGMPFYTPHSLEVVPVLPLMNNPSLKIGGRSDIAPIIPIQDAINKLVADMIIASEFASFHQRWATGIEFPKDEETNEPIRRPDFLASVSRVWASEDPDTKFGQFEASDLGNYVKAIEMLIQHTAALTRTPPHYLLGQSGSFPSGDSLAATETGLVAKVGRKKTNFSPSWEEAIRLSFKVKGDARANQPAETVWADSEQRIRAARIDGALKMTTMGIPQDAIWEETGASPAQIRRWHRMRTEMGLSEYGPEFAPLPPPPPAVLGPDGKPLPGQKTTNLGPDGNLPQEQAITQAARVTRIHD